MEPFGNDSERENHYIQALNIGEVDIVDDPFVVAEMAAALNEYDQIGADLGILSTSCKSFAEDPTRLTRWIIGDEKL